MTLPNNYMFFKGYLSIYIVMARRVTSEQL